MSFTPLRRLAMLQLLDRLTVAGVREADITFICANALHRKYRAAELASMLGEDLVARARERMFCHDAEDSDALVHLGQTAGGHDVEVSRHVVEADLTIYVNAAHNRGFCGGWKSICVGLSTFRSIRHHHTPDGMSMSLKDNRMHHMLDEMGAIVTAAARGPIFKIDTVLADPVRVSQVFAGSVDETRRQAIELLSGAYPPRRSLAQEKFDVLIYGVPNWSPYAMHASMNPLLTLVSSGLGYLGGTVQALGNPGCSVIMVTPCPDEWDTVHHASYPIVWDEVLSQTRDPYRIHEQFTSRFATDAGLIDKYRHHHAFHPVHAIMATQPLRRLAHIGQVLVAGATVPAVVQHLGFTPTDTVEAAVAAAEAVHGADCRIGLVRQAVVPTKLLM